MRPTRLPAFPSDGPSTPHRSSTTLRPRFSPAPWPGPAYNLLVFLAFWTAGLSTYGAMRWLGSGIWGSATAAALFTAAPVHMVEHSFTSGSPSSSCCRCSRPLVFARCFAHPSTRGCVWRRGRPGRLRDRRPLPRGLVLAAGIGVAAVGLGFPPPDSARAVASGRGARSSSRLSSAAPPRRTGRLPRRPCAGAQPPSLGRRGFSLRSAVRQTPTHRATSDSAVLGRDRRLDRGAVMRLARLPLALSESRAVVSLRPELSLLGLEVPMPSKPSIPSCPTGECSAGPQFSPRWPGFAGRVLIDRLRRKRSCGCPRPGACGAHRLRRRG